MSNFAGDDAVGDEVVVSRAFLRDVAAELHRLEELARQYEEAMISPTPASLTAADTRLLKRLQALEQQARAFRRGRVAIDLVEAAQEDPVNPLDPP